MNHLDFAIGLAKQAGPIIKENFALGMPKEMKADRTPLTATDLAINQMVNEAVKKTFPDHGLISEEGGFYSGQEYCWVCDPVDGTIPFSHGVPICMFMLGLMYKGQSILGVVYDPFMDKLYRAEKDQGAYLNNGRIYVSKKTKVEETALNIFSWVGAKYQYPGLFDEVWQKDVFDMNLGCVGYADMMVACGEFTACVFPGETTWDSVAPKIIVEEAGGKFTDLYGNDHNFLQPVQGHLATNGLVHDYFLDLIKKYLVVKQ